MNMNNKYDILKIIDDSPGSIMGIRSDSIWNKG